MYEVTAIKFDEPRGNVLGMASINYGDMFHINSIRIMQARSGDVFVAMPQRKVNQADGSPAYESICCPITREFREELYEKILESFDTGKKVIGEPEQTKPVEYNLSITPYEEMHNYQAGEASIYLDNRFVLNNIKLIVNQQRDFTIGMPSVKPSKPDSQGEWKWNAIFFPKTSEFATKFYSDAREQVRAKIDLEALLAKNIQMDQEIKAAEEKQAAARDSNHKKIPEETQNPSNRKKR